MDGVVVEADGGMVAERCGAGDSLLDADLEGPRRAATCAECADCAERPTKDLYWYLASSV